MHIPEDEAERRRLNERGREILRRKNGAVRPHREDGYVNPVSYTHLTLPTTSRV